MASTSQKSHAIDSARRAYPSSALIIGLCLAFILFLPLVGCGKKGPNKAPGPKSAITTHRVYPAPDQ